MVTCKEFAGAWSAPAIAPASASVLVSSALLAARTVIEDQSAATVRADASRNGLGDAHRCGTSAGHISLGANIRAYVHTASAAYTSILSPILGSAVSLSSGVAGAALPLPLRLAALAATRTALEPASRRGRCAPRERGVRSQRGRAAPAGPGAERYDTAAGDGEGDSTKRNSFSLRQKPGVRL
jgi:hypothetical protein